MCASLCVVSLLEKESLLLNARARSRRIGLQGLDASHDKFQLELILWSLILSKQVCGQVLFIISKIVQTGQNAVGLMHAVHGVYILGQSLQYTEVPR